MFLRHLDYFRSRLAGQLGALPAAELRRSALPSGWTPLELAKHLETGGLRALPTPPGVPVAMRSPGRKLIAWLAYAAISAGPKSMSEVRACCITTPSGGERLGVADLT